MASRQSAVVSGEAQLPRTQPPNGLIHLVIESYGRRRRAWAWAWAWACALGGECASASVVGPGTGPGWHYDGMHAATPAMDACNACNAWLHKKRGPCNPDDALCFYLFSLLASPSRYH
jgi:hypothetical protein